MNQFQAQYTSITFYILDCYKTRSATLFFNHINNQDSIFYYGLKQIFKNSQLLFRGTENVPERIHKTQ
jgi:hypothetical protein